VYSTLQSIIGYETVRGDASAAWIRLGAVLLIAALLAAALLNRRLPD
jgi:Ca-activated chloride channel family protein